MLRDLLRSIEISVLQAADVLVWFESLTLRSLCPCFVLYFSPQSFSSPVVLCSVTLCHVSSFYVRFIPLIICKHTIQ